MLSKRVDSDGGGCGRECPENRAGTAADIEDCGLRWQGDVTPRVRHDSEAGSEPEVADLHLGNPVESISCHAGVH